MARILIPLALVAGLLALPTAAAHTTVSTADGKYFVTVGNLNEPVSTFTKTGLDLIIRANQSGARGPEIPGAHLTLNATLLAPNGEEFTDALRTQFGTTGRYSYAEAYYLTLPGEYFLRLTGRINTTTVDGLQILVGSGPIPAVQDLMFPDAIVSPKELQARIVALEADKAALQAALADADGRLDALERRATPGLDPLAVLVILGFVGAWAARRRPD